MACTLQEKEQVPIFLEKRALTILLLKPVHYHIEDPPDHGPDSKYGQYINGGVQKLFRVGNDLLIIFLEGDFHSRISWFQDAGKGA